MTRALPSLLLAALAFAGCTAPDPPPAQGNETGEAPGPADPAGHVLVVGVHAIVLDMAEAERAAARNDSFVACDQRFSVSANLTARRLAYPSTLGLGRPDPAAGWIELRATEGPRPPDPSRCPPDPYGVAFVPWEDDARPFVFDEYRDRVPLVARPAGVVEVDGTRLLAGERWTKAVEATVNGTRYEGVITFVNLGLWPVANLTEYACTPSDCTPPFSDEPDLRGRASAQPERRRP